MVSTGPLPYSRGPGRLGGVRQSRGGSAGRAGATACLNRWMSANRPTPPAEAVVFLPGRPRQHHQPVQPYSQLATEVGGCAQVALGPQVESPSPGGDAWPYTAR
jgi:hypothetical protein